MATPCSAPALPAASARLSCQHQSSLPCCGLHSFVALVLLLRARGKAVLSKGRCIQLARWEDGHTGQQGPHASNFWEGNGKQVHGKGSCTAKELGQAGSAEKGVPNQAAPSAGGAGALARRREKCDDR